VKDSDTDNLMIAGIIIGPLILGFALIVLGWQIESHRSYIHQRDIWWEAGMANVQMHLEEAEKIRQDNVQKLKDVQQLILDEIRKGQR
jgi:hypothetical protein